MICNLQVVLSSFVHLFWADEMLQCSCLWQRSLSASVSFACLCVVPVCFFTSTKTHKIILKLCRKYSGAAASLLACLAGKTLEISWSKPFAWSHSCDSRQDGWAILAYDRFINQSSATQNAFLPRFDWQSTFCRTCEWWRYFGLFCLKYFCTEFREMFIKNIWMLFCEFARPPFVWKTLIWQHNCCVSQWRCSVRAIKVTPYLDRSKVIFV